MNYEVLLAEQLKEFYLLQPEQATLADNYYFIEKKHKEGNLDLSFGEENKADLKEDVPKQRRVPRDLAT